MSMKLWPILYSNLIYKMGIYFMDKQYNLSEEKKVFFSYIWLLRFSYITASVIYVFKIFVHLDLELN